MIAVFSIIAIGAVCGLAWALASRARAREDVVRLAVRVSDLADDLEAQVHQTHAERQAREALRRELERAQERIRSMRRPGDARRGLRALSGTLDTGEALDAGTSDTGAGGNGVLPRPAQAVPDDTGA